MDEVPPNAGHRIRKSAPREEGLGLEAGGGESLWLAPGESRWLVPGGSRWLAPAEEAYVPLSRDDLPRLLEIARSG